MEPAIKEANANGSPVSLADSVKSIVNSCQDLCVETFDYGLIGKKCQISAIRGHCMVLAESGRHGAPCIELREDERELDSAWQDVMEVIALAGVTNE